MKIVFRNILISIVSVLMALLSYFPYLFIYGALFPLDDHGIKAAAFFYSFGCFALLIIFLSGRFFIKSTGKIKTDILPAVIFSTIIFIIYILGLVPNETSGNTSSFQFLLSTKDMRYLGSAVVELGLYLACCFVPSICLWLGMISRKKNRDIGKESLRQAKLSKANVPIENIIEN